MFISNESTQLLRQLPFEEIITVIIIILVIISYGFSSNVSGKKLHDMD